MWRTHEKKETKEQYLYKCNPRDPVTSHNHVCVAAKASLAWISDLGAGEKNNPGLSRHTLHRKKCTTGLVELAAVMATDKVSRKALKATKAFSNFI
jgi:hypothetical protein